MQHRSYIAFIFLAVASLVSGATIAAAPATPAPAAPTVDWTGFYAGVNGAYSEEEYNWFFPAGGDTDHSKRSGAAGVQAGYNWQFAGNALTGLEATFDRADINAKSTCPNPAASCRDVSHWYGDVSGRLGFVHENNILFIKGGVAFADGSTSGIFPGTPTFNERGINNTRVGYLAGLGVEHALSDSISLKAEFNNMEFNDSGPIHRPGLVENIQTKEDYNVFKIGLNLRF